eukprot:15712950-Heterocapsa_arctica.AAC.1
MVSQASPSTPSMSVACTSRATKHQFEWLASGKNWEASIATVMRMFLSMPCFAFDRASTQRRLH